MNRLKNGLKVSCLIVGISFMLLFNVSCTHTNEYPKETATLDSIGKVLVKTDSMLKAADSVRIRKCVNRVIITVDYVNQLSKDSISSNATDILKNFTNTRWQLQIFLGRLTVLKTEIPKSAKQVANLSHDMRMGLVKKDSALVFYKYETKKAKELIETAKYGLDMVKMEVPINELIAPQADSLVNRLKNHQKI